MKNTRLVSYRHLMLNQLLKNYILKQQNTYFKEKKLFFTPGKGTCLFNIIWISS